jgi:PilZ domain
LKYNTNREKQNKRKFSRVRTYLPFAVRTVPIREFKQVKSHIVKDALVVDFTMPSPVKDPHLAEWLLKLSNKLDAIIHLLTPEKKGFLPVTFKILTIGGNGMCFTSKKAYKIGAFLEIQMVLYTPPYPVLYLYGKAVRVDKGDDGYSIAIEFTDLDEAVQKELLNFNFKQHREMLQWIIANKNLDNLLMLK